MGLVQNCKKKKKFWYGFHYHTHEVPLLEMFPYQGVHILCL